MQQSSSDKAETSATQPDKPAAPMRKGAKTRQRILDCAEILFAQQGYKATGLRDIAAAAEINQPGLYRHFSNKAALYQAVLDRALMPIFELMLKAQQQQQQKQQQGQQQHTEQLQQLMLAVFDRLHAHPHVAHLFQQVMLEQQANSEIVTNWLKQLLLKGQGLLARDGKQNAEQAHAKVSEPQVNIDNVLQLLALYNLCVGYFTNQQMITELLAVNVDSEELLARQKALLLKLSASLV